jgi:DNA-binding NtrC family response regulator
LAETFLQRHVASNQLPTRRFTPVALRALEQYDWPGNVRELTHIIERAVALSTGEWIDRDDLGLEDTVLPVRERPLNGRGAAAYASAATTLEDFSLDAVTQRLVVAALEKTRGHKAQAATLLGVHPRTLTRMLRRYGLPD